MSETIYAQCTEDFMRRMRNWARAGAGQLDWRIKVSSLYHAGPRTDRYVSMVPPMLMGEASDTDAALQDVPVRYRQAVQQFWSREGLPMREHARKMGRHGLDYRTFERWVIAGHELLRIELGRRSSIFSRVSEQNKVSAGACIS